MKARSQAEGRKIEVKRWTKIRHGITAMPYEPLMDGGAYANIAALEMPGLLTSLGLATNDGSSARLGVTSLGETTIMVRVQCGICTNSVHERCSWII